MDFLQKRCPGGQSIHNSKVSAKSVNRFYEQAFISLTVVAAKGESAFEPTQSGAACQQGFTPLLLLRAPQQLARFFQQPLFLGNFLQLNRTLRLLGCGERSNAVAWNSPRNLEYDRFR